MKKLNLFILVILFASCEKAPVQPQDPTADCWECTKTEQAESLLIVNGDTTAHWSTHIRDPYTVCDYTSENIALYEHSLSITEYNYIVSVNCERKQ